MSALSNIVKLTAIAVFGITASLSANAFLLTPGDADADGNHTSGPYGPSNCEPGCINDIFGTSFSNDGDDLLFKAEEPSTETGLLSGSYNWAWNSDLSGGELNWVSGSSAADCSGIGCYLAVKDGNNDPKYYFYDISAWDGTESIQLSGFWEDTNGAISHVSIWGGSSFSVPEPGTAMLLMTGLIGLVACRKRLKKES